MGGEPAAARGAGAEPLLGVALARPHRATR
jgi:hypothetical protein